MRLSFAEYRALKILGESKEPVRPRDLLGTRGFNVSVGRLYFRVLTAAGYAVEGRRDVENHRAHVVYTITDKGRQALKDQADE